MTTQGGPLAGIRVLDLSRVLAGPFASQTLGDLGAEILKIEQPGVGDDTRRWGPPFLEDGSGDAAYYTAANRNKLALSIDFARPEGADLVRRLARSCDVVIENFRAGGLRKYALDYATLSAEQPGLIYCSITGFGQDGPYRERGGYDFLIQGMSGLMSVTGRPEGSPGAGPLKVGIPVSDLFAGLYAAISVLAALRHRDRTGEGQWIDCALFDCQLAVLANQAANYLNGGQAPRALGNQHPNVVPYQDFPTRDGTILVALGNDRQFRALCALLKLEPIRDDPRFADNAGRSAHRRVLVEALSAATSQWSSAELLAAMEAAGLPGGPVNSVGEAFSDPQVVARGLVREMQRPDGAGLRVVGYPAKFSRTPADCRTAPPRRGQDTDATLDRLLGLAPAQIGALRAANIIE